MNMTALETSFLTEAEKMKLAQEYMVRFNEFRSTHGL